MKTLRNICKRLLFPPWWLIIILAVMSAASLTAVFVNGLDSSPVAYVVYAASFYSLTVICIACTMIFPRYYLNIKQIIYSNKYGNRYMTDPAFKTHVSLYRSLAINLLYAAANLFTGVLYCSVWSVTLAVYYTILAGMRFLLVRFVNRNGIGKNRAPELRRSRLCGILLMTLNIALSGVVALVIRKNEGFVYNGILIYVMAIYTFYITAFAVINLFKYRKYNSPVMSAARTVNLAAALVSMLALETAMLTQFGEENTYPHFNQIMVGMTGAGVCVAVILMSVYTIIRANKELAELNNS